MLNLTEDEARNYMQAAMLLNRQLEKENYIQSILAEKHGTERSYPVFEVTYYDNLESMLMALNAGDIEAMEVYSTTARYLIQYIPGLVQIIYCKR